MQFSMFAALLATLALANARDTSKFLKTVPTISNSLVNLGKMEISFHFNGKSPDPSPMTDHNIHNDYYSQPAAEESCPCNSFKSPSFLSDPADIINKILKSNDLFKDPTSTTCCESSEHMQESSVVFELNPNNPPGFNVPKPFKIQSLPNILRSPIIPSYMPLSPTGGKPKAVEIFMFPKKNDMTFDFANFLKPRKTKDATAIKTELQVIRDGVSPPSASVKKDLTVLEKKKNAEALESPTGEMHTDAPPVTNVMNSL